MSELHREHESRDASANSANTKRCALVPFFMMCSHALSLPSSAYCRIIAEQPPVARHPSPRALRALLTTPAWAADTCQSSLVVGTELCELRCPVEQVAFGHASSSLSSRGRTRSRGARSSPQRAKGRVSGNCHRRRGPTTRTGQRRCVGAIGIPSEGLRSRDDVKSLLWE